MARQATGSVVVRKRKRGAVYALRFRAYGDRQFVTLSTAEDGWTPEAAEDALKDTLAQVPLGIWRPQREAAAEDIETPPLRPSTASRRSGSRASGMNWPSPRPRRISGT